MTTPIIPMQGTPHWLLLPAVWPVGINGFYGLSSSAYGANLSDNDHQNAAIVLD